MTTEPTNAELAEQASRVLAHLKAIPMTEWVWSDALIIFSVLETASRLRSDPPVDEPDLREAGDTQVRARALEEAARCATSFLVRDAEAKQLRSPMPHEIASAIRALAGKEPTT